MHELNPTDAQRIDRREDERGLYIGLHRGVWPLYPGETLKIPACTANACDSGRAPCPCPNECHVPEGSNLERAVSFIDRIEARHFWIGYAAFLAAAIGGLCLAFR